jgi:AraC family transcriptional regulator
MARVLSIVTGVFGRACLLDKDRKVSTHAHPEPHVLLKIGGEDLEYEVSDVVAPCTRDKVVLVNAMEIHGNRSIGNGRSIILALYLSPEWLIQKHASLLVGGRMFEQPSEKVALLLRERADHLANDMMRVEGIGLKQDRLQFLATEVALAVFDQCSRSPERVDRLGKLNDFRIRRAVSYMRENVSEATDIADVAERVGLSRSRFFDLFTECTGLSPKHYLDMLRMERAIGELTSSHRTIAEISDHCGYSAQSHFTRFFIRQIGVTPSEYRRACGSVNVSL